MARAALLQVTQLGHVKDLATAFVKCLGNEKAYNQIYNISGEPLLCLHALIASGASCCEPLVQALALLPAGKKFVTFDGIAKACAKAMGQPEPELVHFNPKVGGAWPCVASLVRSVHHTGCCCSPAFTPPWPGSSACQTTSPCCAQEFDFGKEKAFPLRDQHFFTSIDKVGRVLG